MEQPKFGVTLKSAGSVDKEKMKVEETKSKPSNIKDIKNMFDIQKGVVPTQNFGIDFGKEKLKKGSSVEEKKDDLAFFSQFKFNIDVNKNTTMERDVKGFDRQDSNRGSFGKKVHVIKTAEPPETVAAEPQVAKAKVFSGGKTFQASTENKVRQRSETDDNSYATVNKSNASFSLQANLAILRTRPGSGQKSEMVSNPVNVSTGKESSSVSKETSWKKTDTNTEKDLSWVKKAESTTSRIKSWEQGSVDGKESGSKWAPGHKLSGNVSPRTQDSESQNLKLGKSPSSEESDIKTQRLSGNLSPRSRDGELKTHRLSGNLSPRSKESESKTELGLAYTRKHEISGITSRTLHSRQSSSDSSASSLSSPRLSLRKATAVDQPSSGNVSPTTRSFSPVNNAQQSPTTEPEWMNKSKELVGKFHTKLKKPETNTSSITPKSVEVSSPKSASVGVPGMKNEGHTWKPNSPTTATSDISSFTKNLKPVGKVTAKLTKEPLRKTESFGDSDSSSSSVDIKKRQFVVRKMSSEQLQKIKGKFEQDSTDSQPFKPKQKVEICTTKNLIERKSSLEKQTSSEVTTNRLKTLKHLQQDGKLLNIKDRISALNKGQGEIVRPRISSSGSSEKGGEEYNDIEGFEVYQENKAGDDWPTTSDSEDDGENMYEYIPATDPAKQPSSSANKRNSSTVPSRRHGLKNANEGKGSNRPSLEKEDYNDSSSEFTASSKEGTLESTDDRAGVDGDIEEYNSDSSHSGIYEPISGEWANRVRRSNELGSQEDLPPELPPDRVKKKNKKGIFKQFKQKLQQPKSNTDPSMSKVSSAPSLTATGSSGLLKKMGKMMKRTKSSGNQAGTYNEEVGICQSDSSDNQEESIYEDEPIHMKPCPEEGMPFMDQDSASGSDYYEDEILDPVEEVAVPQPPPRPPPPPPVAPPLPPRTSATAASLCNKSVTPTSAEDDSNPVLPPRSRVSGNFSLETVVPVGQGIVPPTPHVNGKSSWAPTKDSYLHGHQVLDNKLSSNSSSDDSHCTQDDYIQPDPPKKGGPIRQDSLPVEMAPPPPPPPPVPRGREKESLDKRPSSGYVRFKDTARPVDENLVTAPFNHLMMYKSQLQLDKEEEEDLYIDLSDENQLFGALERRYTTKFESEPLYQCYHRDKVSRASAKNTIVPSSDLSDEETESGDSIYEVLPEIGQESQPDKPKLSTLDMFGKTGSVLRALWCEMPEVKESGILGNLTSHERKIQESMFEIITSEASYLKSLNVLMDVFLMSPEFSSELSDKCVITRQERHVLFSNIGAVREASEKFLSDLEQRWQQSVFITDICDIIHQNASSRFECYVRYCSNQTFQERATQELMKRAEVAEVVRRLERNPACQGLPMISFLLLPMQRITRLPLLVDAICHRLDPATDRHRSATKALDALNRIVRKCNDGARKMQQTEQMCHLVQNLEFKVKEIPLISASRYLVKQGELIKVITESSSRLPFGKGKASKQSLFVYLFNDMFLISKRKGNNVYVVTDYAKRNSIHVENIDQGDKSKGGYKNLFRVVLLENHEQRQVELVFSCKSASDKSRWIDALSPATREVEDEKIYEEWDCPQVQCIHHYTAMEPDELTLEESDVVNVFKKMSDGWYEGERIRDGEKGWFPANCTVEIVNSHVRARNLRLRYRLMQASEDFREVYNKAKS